MPPRRFVYNKTTLMGLPEFMKRHIFDFISTEDLPRVCCLSKHSRRHNTITGMAMTEYKRRVKEDGIRHVFVLNESVSYSDRSVKVRTASKRFNDLAYCHHVIYGEPKMPSDFNEVTWGFLTDVAKYKYMATESHKHTYSGYFCPKNIPYLTQAKPKRLKLTSTEFDPCFDSDELVEYKYKPCRLCQCVTGAYDLFIVNEFSILSDELVIAHSGAGMSERISMFEFNQSYRFPDLECIMNGGDVVFHAQDIIDELCVFLHPSAAVSVLGSLSLETKATKEYICRMVRNLRRRKQINVCRKCLTSESPLNRSDNFVTSLYSVLMMRDAPIFSYTDTCKRIIQYLKQNNVRPVLYDMHVDMSLRSRVGCSDMDCSRFIYTLENRVRVVSRGVGSMENCMDLD